MAYRFQLEVPESLYEEANLIINQSPNAGIVDVHNGIGENFDANGRTLTLVAYTLEIIQRLQDWYAGATHDSVPVSIALTNGTHMVPGEASVSDMVAAIRRDQPWVERSIPKIGDHATRIGPAGSGAVAVAAAQTTVAQASAAAIEILATDEPTDHPTLNVSNTTFLHLGVVDLALPKRAYAEIFGAELVGEADRGAEGSLEWRTLGEETSPRPDAQAAYAFMQNGPLNMALERLGRAYPLEVFIKIPAPVRLLVTDSSYQDIKANVLSRSWQVMDDSTPGVFGFRDPFGYTWSIHSESFEKGVPSHA